MKILLAVASKHGSTREIAQTIADELRATGLDLDLRAVGEVDDISDYDVFILGSAIYAGNWLPELRSFAERHYAELADQPVWLFSSGPLGSSNPQPPADPGRFAAPLGTIAVREHRVFPGRLDKEGLSLGERIIMATVQAPEGDFRAWDEIRAWAGSIAAALQPGAVTGA